MRKLHNKENSTNYQNIKKPPQTQQYNQDEETEEYSAGKGTGELPTKPNKRGRTGDIENYGNNGKGPVWWYPMEKMYSDDNRPSQEQLENMKQKLLVELDKLL